MALQVNIEQSSFGVPFNSAYYRVVGVGIEHAKNTDTHHRVSITVFGYATQPLDYGVREVDQRVYFTSLLDVENEDGSDFLSKCYKWLMKHPDFNTSVPT